MTTEHTQTNGNELRILAEDISNYMEYRGQLYPDKKSALDFAITEWGELLEEMLRPPPVSKFKIRYEFGDVYQMLQIACTESLGVPLEDCPVPTELAHTHAIGGITIIFAKLIDAYFRLDNKKWVRNNERTVDLSLLFGELFVALSFLSDRVTGAALSSNLLEKWASKGYEPELT